MKTLNDLTAPVAIQRKPLLEAEVQGQCVDWMRKRGYWARKFSSMTQRSVPDYLFAFEVIISSKHGTDYYPLKFFTEFKREGAKRDANGLMSTEAQQDEQKAMRAAGWDGFECDNFEAFKLQVAAYEKEWLPPRVG